MNICQILFCTFYLGIIDIVYNFYILIGIFYVLLYYRWLLLGAHLLESFVRKNFCGCFCKASLCQELKRLKGMFLNIVSYDSLCKQHVLVERIDRLIRSLTRGCDQAYRA